MTDKKQSHLMTINDSISKLLKAKVDALPGKDKFNQTRFLHNAMTVVKETKDIDKMTPMSVARTILKGAFLGLDFFMRECYAIPYGKSLTFQTDYKGEVKICKKWAIDRDNIKDIYAKVVRKGDHFLEYIKAGQQTIDFSPKSFSNADIIGAFAVCLYLDGSLIYETMSVDEIEKIRQVYSKQPNGLMWKNSFGEGCKKTVLRRLTKMIQIDFDNEQQETAYSDSADMKFDNAVEYEEISMPVETPSQDPPLNLESDEKLERTPADPEAQNYPHEGGQTNIV